MKLLLKTCLVASLLLAQAAFAQGSVSSTLDARRVDTLNGKAVLTLAESGKPGDLVEYSGTYRNGGKAAAGKLLATIPVPAGTTFVAGTADPVRAQASTDGTSFAAMPLMRTVKLANGGTREEAVPLAEYRFIRWDLGTLAPGADAVVKLRVRIDAVVAQQ